MFKVQCSQHYCRQEDRVEPSVWPVFLSKCRSLRNDQYSPVAPSQCIVKHQFMNVVQTPPSAGARENCLLTREDCHLRALFPVTLMPFSPSPSSGSRSPG